MASRDASTSWTGGLKSGYGETTFDSSGIGTFKVSFPTRSGDPAGQTSPEELIAAAHSSCLAMNLSGVLEQEELDIRRLDVSATATLGSDPAGGFAITKVHVMITADVPGVSIERFSELATVAKDTCPVTKALAGTTITFEASLAA